MSETGLAVLAGCVTVFGLGWIIGKWIKTTRQFLDMVD